MKKNTLNEQCMYACLLMIIAFAYLFCMIMQFPELGSPDFDFVTKMIWFAPALVLTIMSLVLLWRAE